MAVSNFKLLLLLLLLLGCLVLVQAAPIPRSTFLWSDFFRYLRGSRAIPPPPSQEANNVDSTPLSASPYGTLAPCLPELDLGPKFDSYDITTSYEQLANPWAYSPDAPFADFQKRGLEDSGAGLCPSLHGIPKLINLTSY